MKALLSLLAVLLVTTGAKAQEVADQTKDESSRFIIKERGISITVPKGWKGKENADQYAPPFQAGNKDTGEAFVVDMLSADSLKIKSADEYPDKLGQKLAGSGMSVVKKGELNLGWTKAAKAVLSVNPDKQVQVDYLVVFEERVIRVSFFVPEKNWKDREAFFDNVVKSLRIEKLSAVDKTDGDKPFK